MIEQIISDYGFCDQGAELLRRHGSLRAVCIAVQSGDYSDETLAEVVKIYWGAIRRRLWHNREGYAYNQVNAPTLSDHQMKFLRSRRFDCDAYQAVADIMNRIYSKIYEKKRRLLTDELQLMITFIELGDE